MNTLACLSRHLKCTYYIHKVNTLVRLLKSTTEIISIIGYFCLFYEEKDVVYKDIK